MSEIKCINLGYVVPKDKADEVLELFKTHAAWMQEFYSDSNDGSKYLISSFFTKADEFVNPADPSQGLTGNVVFTINERFTSMDSVKRHVENAMKNDYFEEIANIFQNYAKVLSNSGVIYHSIR